MKYQILSPIKIGNEIISDGYYEIADSDVLELQNLGAIGEAEAEAEAEIQLKKSRYK